MTDLGAAAFAMAAGYLLGVISILWLVIPGAVVFFLIIVGTFVRVGQALDKLDAVLAQQALATAELDIVTSELQSELDQVAGATDDE